MNEGGVQGQLSNLLRDLGQGVAAFHQDMGDRMDDVVFVSMSEFGRTAHENGNRGTDHGHANCMFVMGGDVKGGKGLHALAGTGRRSAQSGPRPRRDHRLSQRARRNHCQASRRSRPERGISRLRERPAPIPGACEGLIRFGEFSGSAEACFRLCKARLASPLKTPLTHSAPRTVFPARPQGHGLRCLCSARRYRMRTGAVRFDPQWPGSQARPLPFALGIASRRTCTCATQDFRRGKPRLAQAGASSRTPRFSCQP